jgi:hypothetical protein
MQSIRDAQELCSSMRLMTIDSRQYLTSEPVWILNPAVWTFLHVSVNYIELLVKPCVWSRAKTAKPRVTSLLRFDAAIYGTGNTPSARP